MEQDLIFFAKDYICVELRAFLDLFDLLHFPLALDLMLLTVDLDVPFSDFELLLHILGRMDELAFHGASDVEDLLAAIEVTRDAGAMLLLADVTGEIESSKVHIAAKVGQTLVVSVEPDFIMPVDTGVVDPFARH